MREDLYPEMYRQEEYYWWHKAKRNLVKTFLPTDKNLTILDVGCGTGKLLEELQNRGEVWGIDQSAQAVKFCRLRGLRHVYKVAFPHAGKFAQKFDVVTCLDVLEHVADDQAAIKGIYKLLKPHGKVIITVPAYKWLFSYWDTILKHHRRYDKSQLVKLIRAHGFSIKKTSFVYSFLLLPVIMFRIIRHQLFKSTKPRSDFIEMPAFAHSLLFTIATIEQFLVRYINLPFGLSLVCIAEKK